MKTKWLALLMTVASAGIPAVAQQGPPDDDQEGPGRGVARVSLLNGDVSVRRGDSGDLVAAGLNVPLMAQDSLVVGPNSRAEIQFDYGNLLRIGMDSEVRLSGLEYRRYQIQVGRGTVMYRVLRDYHADVEVITPSVSVRPVRQGSYRISVRDDGTSEIDVRSGEVDIFTPRGTERLAQGRTMLVRGDASDPEFQIVAGAAYDEWDRWNEIRDRELLGSQSYRYVSPDVSGAEDLDGHGEWVQDQEYGQVWSPYVAPGWAPYREGRWSWEDYYGWTWVSYDPWGWAPYHYGRWFVRGSRWCWYPGGVGVGYHHYWRPALVAFFGFGNGGGISVGFGNVGWVPLAPFERYHPWFGRGIYGGYRGTTIVNNTTIINNTNIYSSYRNARVYNGVTAVNYSTFGRGRVGNFVSVNGTDLRQVNLVRGQLPVVPDRGSLRFNDRAPRADLTPRALDSRQFRSFRQTAPVERVPFAQQQQRQEQLAQRFGIRPSESIGREQRPFTAAPRADRPYAAVPQSPGQAFGREARPAIPQGNVPNADRSGRDWSRFGEPSHREGMNIERSNPAWNGSTGRALVPQNNRDAGWGRFGQQDRPDARAPRPERNLPQQSYRPQAPAYQPRYDTPRQQPAPNYQQRYESPRQAVPSYQPRYESPSPRQQNPGYQPRFESPRQQMPSYQPRQQAPSYQPRAESPRFNAPARSESHSAPAPRTESHGGGGGSSHNSSGGHGRH